eukprot:TRINITY_DN10582_c0_g1_i1.p1 TRINITY_DN10582_c0_g1~~TRINITY_DN10582_c0_g1_i1.p1  ORF type:complete len:910 (+),score=170.03 TRINITY_DN10582_c0_g1_i1:1658-4387(+)
MLVSSYLRSATSIAMDIVLNRTNKQLHQKLQEFERKLQRETTRLAECREAVEEEEKHIAAITAEQERIRSVVGAHSDVLNTENHLVKLVCGAAERIKAEQGDLHNRGQWLKKKIKDVRAELDSKGKRLQQLANGREEELKVWLQRAHDRGAAAQGLEEMSKADTSRIEALRRRLEQALQQVKGKQAEMIDGDQALMLVQVELAAVANQQNALLQERKQTLEQWEQAASLLFERGEAHTRNISELEKLRELRRKRDSLLDGLQAQKRAIEQESDALESRVQRAHKAKEALASEKSDTEKGLLAAEKEVSSLQLLLGRTAANLQGSRENLRQLGLLLANRRAAFIELRARDEEYRAMLELHSDNRATLGATTAAQDQILEHMDAQFTKVDHSFKVLSEQRNEATANLRHLRAENTQLSQRATAAAAGKRKVEEGIQQLEAEARNVDASLELVETDVARLREAITAAEADRQAKEEALREKQKMLLERKSSVECNWQLLNSNLQSARDALVLSQREVRVKTVRFEQLQSEIILAKAELAAAQREIEKKREEKIAGSLQLEVLRLNVERLRCDLQEAAGGVLDATGRKDVMTEELQRRMAATDEHRRLLMTELNAASEERRQYQVDLSQKRATARHAENRYNDILTAMRTNLAKSNGTAGRVIDEDDILEPANLQALHMLLAAQERETLTAQLEEITAAVAKAERDLANIERSAALLQSANLATREGVGSGIPRSYRLESETMECAKATHRLTEVQQQQEFLEQQVCDARKEHQQLLAAIEALRSGTAVRNETEVVHQLEKVNTEALKALTNLALERCGKKGSAMFVDYRRLLAKHGLPMATDSTRPPSPRAHPLTPRAENVRARRPASPGSTQKPAPVRRSHSLSSARPIAAHHVAQNYDVVPIRLLGLGLL